MAIYGTLRSSGLDFAIESSADWSVFQEIFVEGTYAPAVDMALQYHTMPRWRVLDLGCNVGYFTTFLLDRLVREGLFGFAFDLVDGSPREVALAQQRLSNQKVLKLDEKFKVHHGIVGAQKDGEASFHVSTFHGMNGTEEHCASPKEDVEVVTVPFLNLDLFQPDYTFIKCDIEGAEEEVLRTYPELFRQSLFAAFEFHDSACDTAACRRMLREYGYVRETAERRGNVSVEGWRREKK